MNRTQFRTRLCPYWRARTSRVSNSIMPMASATTSRMALCHRRWLNSFSCRETGLWGILEACDANLFLR